MPRVSVSCCLAHRRARLGLAGFDEEEVPVPLREVVLCQHRHAATVFDQFAPGFDVPGEQRTPVVVAAQGMS